MNPFELVVFFSMIDPRVTVLIEKMADDKQCVREAAYRRLVKMDERAVPQISVASQSHADAEVRMRCRRLMALQIGAVSIETYPWIDCLPKDFPDREKIIEAYYKEFNHESEDCMSAEHLRVATGLFARRLVEKGWRRATIKRILEDMGENEEKWKNNAGGRHGPPPDFDK